MAHVMTSLGFEKPLSGDAYSQEDPRNRSLIKSQEPGQ